MASECGGSGTDPLYYAIELEQDPFQPFEEVLGKQWDGGEVQKVVHEAEVPEGDDIDKEVGEEGGLQDRVHLLHGIHRVLRNRRNRINRPFLIWT